MTNINDILLSMLAGGNNPQEIVNNMVRNNPQLNAVLNQARTSGMSMKDFTMQYARQNGINLQPMLDIMSRKGFRF